MTRKLGITGCLLALCLAAPAWPGQKPFAPGSLAEIEQAYDGERFILVLWQIDCAPCHGEMIMLGKLLAEHPQMNLVLVGMDPLELRAETGALLDEYGLAGADSWLFAEDNLERLRHDIDPAWYGEAPRNYLYDAAGARSGFSGKLDEQKVRDWLSLEEAGATAQ